jgi:hypothetical protein
MDWNSDVHNLDEQIKAKLEDEASELAKLIGHWQRCGWWVTIKTQCFRVCQYDWRKWFWGWLHNIRNLDFTRQDLNFEDIVTANTDDVDIDTMLVDVNDIETKIFKLKDAQAFGRDFVNFMLGSGSRVFTTTEILQMNRICDKLTKMHFAQLASSKQSDIRSFFTSN